MHEPAKDATDAVTLREPVHAKNVLEILDEAIKSAPPTLPAVAVLQHMRDDAAKAARGERVPRHDRAAPVHTRRNQAPKRRGDDSSHETGKRTARK